MQEGCAVLLREELSRKDHRGAVSSNGPYSEFRDMPNTTTVVLQFPFCIGHLRWDAVCNDSEL